MQIETGRVSPVSEAQYLEFGEAQHLESAT
jgi:hypothetical protein